MSKKAELVGSHFPTIYLTVISLLQGIALSIIVPNFITYLDIVENPWSHVEVIPMVLMLLIIFIVWHHYAIGIFFLRWFPNIIDTIIPFVVSIGQFYLMSFLKIENSITEIDVVSWTLGFAFFMMIGSAAYFAAYFRIDADLFTNLMSKANAVIHRDSTKKYFLVAGFSILFQGSFALFFSLLHKENWLVISLFLMLSHLVIFEYILIRFVKPHFVKSLDEFEEKGNNH
ncbi:MAG TPA: hypothetical protein VN763_15870 [Saprospiraceae bacterium]|nr:hypothetical protein [Saprospiraceae bacterium]HZV45185.1 hypothetical protein [Saprospiraceae bacterium]